MRTTADSAIAGEALRLQVEENGASPRGMEMLLGACAYPRPRFVRDSSSDERFQGVPTKSYVLFYDCRAKFLFKKGEDKTFSQDKLYSGQKQKGVDYSVEPLICRAPIQKNSHPHSHIAQW